MKGIKEYRNKAGLYVLSVHYSADPDKDPTTEKGRKWIDQKKKEYTDEGWEREMEINFSVSGGNRMFKNFKRAIYCTSLKYDPNRLLYCGWDFGYHHPAIIFAQINDYDQLCLLGELMGTDIALPEFKMEVKAYAERHFPKVKIADSDYIKHIPTKAYCDPHGNDKLGINKNAKTYVDILKAPPYKVIVRFRRFGKDIKIEFVRDLLIIRNDGNPGVLIDDDMCPILVKGMEGGYCSKKNDMDMPADDEIYEHLQDCLQELVVNIHRKLGLLSKKKMVEEENKGKRRRTSPIIKRTYNKFTGY